MSAKGYLQVNAYTSNARIPLKDVAITVADEKGTPLALRLTNRSGQLNELLEFQVPNLEASQTPESETKPYRTVNIDARLENYELIEVERAQIFPKTITIQNLEMIPLSEFPENRNLVEIFDTFPQEL